MYQSINNESIKLYNSQLVLSEILTVIMTGSNVAQHLCKGIGLQGHSMIGPLGVVVVGDLPGVMIVV